MLMWNYRLDFPFPNVKLLIRFTFHKSCHTSCRKFSSVINRKRAEYYPMITKYDLLINLNQLSPILNRQSTIDCLYFLFDIWTCSVHLTVRFISKHALSWYYICYVHSQNVAVWPLVGQVFWYKNTYESYILLSENFKIDPQNNILLLQNWAM